MYNSLPSATPATTAVLNINPRGRLTETPIRDQTSFLMDNFDDVVVVSHSDEVGFEVTIPFNTLNNTDSEAVLDLYSNTAGAYGFEYSFVWNHPKDNHSYVVRFASDLSRTIKFNHWHKYKSFKLYVLGNY